MIILGTINGKEYGLDYVNDNYVYAQLSKYKQDQTNSKGKITAKAGDKYMVGDRKYPSTIGNAIKLFVDMRKGADIAFTTGDIDSLVEIIEENNKLLTTLINAFDK